MRADRAVNELSLFVIALLLIQLPSLSDESLSSSTSLPNALPLQTGIVGQQQQPSATNTRTGSKSAKIAGTSEDLWQSSGAGPPSNSVVSPDDEPGDDEDGRGSGEPIEGSGEPPPRRQEIIRPQLPLVTSSATTTTTTPRTSFNKQGEEEDEEDEEDEEEAEEDDDADLKIDEAEEQATPGTLLPPPHVRENLMQRTTVPPTAEVDSHIGSTTTTTTTRRPLYAAQTTTSRPPPPPQVTPPPYVETDAHSIEMLKPGILAAISGGSVIAILLTILLVMFVVYRLRKKDEGSYSLDEPRHPPNYSYAYQKAPTREFYA